LGETAPEAFRLFFNSRVPYKTPWIPRRMESGWKNGRFSASALIISVDALNFEQLSF